MTEEDKVIQISRKIRQAMVDQDTAYIAQAFAERATLTHITGYVQSKKEWIDYMKKGRMPYFTATENAIWAEMDGGRAQVTVQNRVDALIFGTCYIWPLQLTLSFERQGAEWKILQALASSF